MWPRLFVAAVATVVAVVALAAVETARIDAALVRRHVEVLASDRSEGRLAGSEGERVAAEYIASELSRTGVQPLPGADDFFLPFEFIAGVSDAGSSLTMRAGPDAPPILWSHPGSVRALAFSDSAVVTGQAVFAGYGLSVPVSAGVAYNSYASLDVKDKIVVVLRYFPEEADERTRGVLARYAALRYKAVAARDRGAKGLIVVAGPRSPNAGRTIPVTVDSSAADSDIAAVSVGADIAGALFAHLPDRTLAEVQRQLDTGDPHVTGFEFPEVELTVDVQLTRERRTGHNLVGYLPPTGGETAKPYVVLGAHYDHLGRGTHGSSLARREEAERVHYGADDNASGVAAVLAAAQMLARADRTRGLVVAFWSGEEIGLLGSSDFVTRGPVRVEEIAAYVNFDMVGRMEHNDLTVQGVGSSGDWRSLLEQVNRSIGFDLALRDDPYVPTDLTSFYQAGVPGVSLFTGSHDDYHRPSDVASAINFEDLARVARFGARLAVRLAHLGRAPAYVKVERTAPRGDRAGPRAFTGTIPDYMANDVQGLRLSGVLDGGPAAAAGLRRGDVIIAFGDQTITNIYDYMHALEVSPIGRPVTVVYLRQGELRQAILTPEARR